MKRALVVTMIFTMMGLAACSSEKTSEESDRMINEITINPIEVEEIQIENTLKEEVLREEILYEDVTTTWDDIQ